jgi:predicted ATPase
VGKTRLVVELVQAMFPSADRRRTRVACCNLSEARSQADVCHAVGAVLGLGPNPGESVAERLGRIGREIAARDLALVVLDNFEQVLAEASVVRDWIESTDHTRFIVTSREPLRLGAERRFELAPLSVGTNESDAVELFLDRSRQVRPDYSPSPAEARTVAELVAAVDGLPLAIELCAARMAVLSPEQIASRLRPILAAPRGPAVDAPARHESLDAVLAWSWGLLAPPERDALARLSVFRGGFTVDAVERALRPSPGPEAPAMLDVLTALREKSLLKLEATSPEVRLGMLHTVRAFAAERLGEMGGDATAERRHAELFAELARSLAAQAHGPQGARALERLEAEMDNLLAVVDRALAGDADGDLVALGGEVLLAVDVLFSRRGPHDVLAELLDRAVAAADRRALSATLRARLLIARGRAARTRGDFADAERDLERARALAEQIGDDRRAGMALGHLGLAWQLRGEIERAVPLLERALDVLERCGEEHFSAMVLGFLAHGARALGQHDVATAWFARAIERFVACGDRRGEGIARLYRADVWREQGRLEDAGAEMDRSGALLREVADHQYHGIGLLLRGGLLQQAGKLDDAGRAYEQALALCTSVGDRPHLALVRSRLATVAAGRGRLDEAERLHREAERDLTALGDALRLAVVHVDAGHLDLVHARAARAAGRATEAASHLVRAHGRLAGGQTARSPELRLGLVLLEQALGPETRADRARMGVCRDGRWVTLPDGRRLDLRRHGPARRILFRLIAEHATARGRPVSHDELVAAGWPGTRLLPDAAVNRLYVTVATLRKMGLRGLLLSNDDGYLLDPDAVVVEE